MLISEYKKIVMPCIDKNAIVAIPRINKLLKSHGAIVPVTPYINGSEDSAGQTLLPREKYQQINNFCPPSEWIDAPHRYYFVAIFKKIIQDAINQNVDRLLFVEDDLDIPADFDQILEKGMKSLPDDWHFFYYGSNNIWHPTKQVGENLLLMQGGYCMHMLGISSKVFEELLTIPYVQGVDIAIAKAFHHRNKSFTLFPGAIQRPGHSTLVGTHVNYLDFFKSKGINHDGIV